MAHGGATPPDAHEALENSLTNHAPASDEVIQDYENLRAFAKDLGHAILNYCPPSRERSLAITHLEETVMWAVKSIAINT